MSCNIEAHRNDIRDDADDDEREDESANMIIKNMRLSTKNKLLIAHLNINSIRNKIEALKCVVSGNIDILIIAETKVDDTFPTSQFCIDGYMPPLRADRNQHGGGLLIYIRDGVPAREVAIRTLTSKEMEIKVVEINLHKTKWLLIGIYRPPSQSEKFFFEELSKNLELYLANYENFLIVGDFNLDEKSSNLKDFMNSFNLENIVKEPTCFKSDSPTCIDLILTSDTSRLTNTATIETGLSDFHIMIATALKGGFHKRGPKVVTYRDYNKFRNSAFTAELMGELAFSKENNTDFTDFNKITKRVLDRHAPCKKKYVRANDGPFMTKELRKAIMKRSRLKNKFNKCKTNENWIAFKKQRNFCVKLLRQSKKSYYSKLDPKVVSDNKQFWKTVKPLFSNKIHGTPCITLLEDNVVVSDDTNVAEIFNEYFVDIAKGLGIAKKQDPTNMDGSSEDTLQTTIERFRCHSSVAKIGATVCCLQLFSFRQITIQEMFDQLIKLDPKKATPQEAIPPKILRENADLFSLPLTQFFNKLVVESAFPNDLKLADISSLYKKDDNMKKQNYRPISLLPAISKVFERIIYNQLIDYISAFLSPLLGGFRKGCSTEHVLLKFLQTCKASLDNKELAGAILMDLSKAFDCIDHNLLIAKLAAYGLGHDALKLIKSYLTKRKQRVKINGSYSTYRDITIGVPQGSVLGPLLFNIFINDIFLFVQNTSVCNYADDTTIYACNSNLDTIINRLETDSSILAKWFSENYMKLNEEKCHFMIFGNKNKDSVVAIGKSTIKESEYEKLLGVTFDKKLSFTKHVQDLCKKAHQKLHALARLSNYIDPIKLKLLMDAFITSQFNYCPLVWMFHDRRANAKINKVTERALRIACNDSGNNSMNNYCNYNKSLTVHQRNLQLLMIEIFKTKSNLNPTFMKDIFVVKNSYYSLRNPNHFQLPNVRTTIYGIENIQFRGCSLWSSLPNSMKNSESLQEFKRRIKHWDEISCNCRLCKVFIKDIGFLN